jgi:GxxExxY protein
VNRRDAEVAEEKEQEPGGELNRLTRGVIGAAIEVHRILGPGLLESIYEQALCVELELVGIPFARQVPVRVKYKDRGIGEARLDLLVAEMVIVELKAASDIAPVHLAQVLSYLKLTRLRLGLLINFNVSELRAGVRRVIYTP